MTIRPATPADAETLTNLARETYADAFGHSMHERDLAAHLDRHLSADCVRRMIRDDMVLLATLDHQLVGFVQFGSAAALVEACGDNDVELRRLYVRRDAQNQGFGMALLDAALTHPDVAGRRVLLDVWEENEGALRLYKRYGFEVIGQRRFEVASGTESGFDLVLARSPRA